MFVPLDAGFNVADITALFIGVQETPFLLLSLEEFGLSWGIPATVATSFFTLIYTKHF